MVRSWARFGTGWARAGEVHRTEYAVPSRKAISQSRSRKGVMAPSSCFLSVLGTRCSVLLLLAVAEGHEGVAGDHVRVALHPAVLLVDPAAVGPLPLRQRLDQFRPPVVLLALGVGEFVHAH